MKPSRPTEQGWIVLLAVLAMLAITVAFLGAAANNNSAKLERKDITATALAQAKAALLAYTISRDDGSGGARPGEFPCPTTVGPEDTTYGTANSNCAGVRLIGRLPWRTLGIAELFDEAGEPLWYVLSPSFSGGIAVINNSSKGQLVVYASDGTTIQENQAAVVIFSAGPPLQGQNRSTAAAACATTMTSIPANQCAANYGDTFSGKNNATNSGPFVVGTKSNTFNDNLAYITTSDFMPRVEERVAKAVATTVKGYYTKFGYYPYAAYYSDASQSLRKNQANCAANTFSGRFPEDISISGSPPVSLPPCMGLKEWSDVDTAYQLPIWYFVNRWNLSTYYAVGKAFAPGGSKMCAALGDCLTVDADPSVQALVMLPGIPLASQNRVSNLLTDYFEVAENLEGWPTLVNYIFKSDTTRLPTSDRVIAIKN